MPRTLCERLGVCTLPLCFWKLTVRRNVAQAKLEVCSLCDGDLGDSLRVARTLHEEGYSERFGLAAEGADEKTIIIAVVAVLHREARGGVLAEERVKHHGGLLLGVDVLLVEDAYLYGAIEEL